MKKIQNRRFGELLVENGLITQKQLEIALEKSSGTNIKIGEILVEQGIVEERQISKILEIQLGIPYIDLEKTHIDAKLPRLIPEKMARDRVMIPVSLYDKTLTVAMMNPTNIYAIDDVKISTGMDVKPVIAGRQDIIRAIGLFYEKEGTDKALEEFDETYVMELFEDIDGEILENVEKAPIVKLLNSIIHQSIKMRASDIHIEPLEKILRVRFRIDGDLQEIMRPPQNSHSAIVTRIKIMSGMDIAEKRIPQDGRLSMDVDGDIIDMRISVVPTVHGEKVMIRILDRSAVLLTKNELGFNNRNLEIFNRIIQHPHGIIMVTGPTGSGKTTTLYSVLQEINKINRNIITVEDPVEYRLAGINQIQVNTKAGLTFANGLRSILRQDPDVIMIGEIRDSDTAQIAIRAAITGHLVLATVHTNNTVSTITRLMNMGIENYMISSATVGIMAQRLVKKICINCKESYEPNYKEEKMLNLPDDAVIYRGKGCNLCNHTGYRGRTGIFEIMPISDSIKSMIEKTKSTQSIQKKALAEGMTTLRDNCAELVRDGIISFDEMLRVTFSME